MPIIRCVIILWLVYIELVALEYFFSVSVLLMLLDAYLEIPTIDNQILEPRHVCGSVQRNIS